MTNYPTALYNDTGATLDDLREAVATLEDAEPTARRVLGSAHPLAKTIGNNIRTARAALQAATENKSRIVKRGEDLARCA